MPIAIHWDWEGHSALKPLQSSCTETLLAPRTAVRAAARATQIFAVFIFEYRASIRNIQKFAPFENFPLYGTSWYSVASSPAPPPPGDEGEARKTRQVPPKIQVLLIEHN